MKRVIIVQARMTSTRLPGKVLLDLAGRPMLSQQLARLRRCQNADEICIATTTNRDDDPIVALAEREGVSCFRGDEQDVLSRYVGAARQTRAELVVRVTSDCPLIDPGITDRVIAKACDPSSACDYVSNTVPRTYPRGLDAEALSTKALCRAAATATSRPSREHVTWFIHTERPDLFVLGHITDDRDRSTLRWTVDTQEDLAAVRAIYALMDGVFLPYEALVEEVLRHPEIAALNAGVAQKVR